MEINCFYFGKFGYTIVPAQIKEDVQRIKDHGARYVTLNVIEQDYKAAVENIDITVNEIVKAGMKPILATERWLGIFGGVQHFPSVFTLKRPDTQLISENGEVMMTELGPVSSLYHEKAEKEIRKMLDKTFEIWGFEGLMWYEPKLPLDYSSTASEVLGGDITPEKHLQFYKSVFSKYNQRIKEKFGDKIIGWLNHPHTTEKETTTFSEISGINFFGYQGRPWPENGGSRQLHLPDLNLPFTSEGMKNFMVINNVGLDVDDQKQMEQNINMIINKKPDVLGYYYFPANVSQPKEAMDIIFKAIS